ncbi:MAG: hypothetical protein E6G09_14035 [Actinobacteria bacterium]|nr:MAG: hypothetical protein E6G09_14035 [Actinomycetota bacterium]
MTADEAGSRIRGGGGAASTSLRGTVVFGFGLRTRTGRGRAGRLCDSGRTCAGITRWVRVASPDLATLGRLGLSTGRLAATFVAAGCGLSGTGSASAPDCAGAAVGGTGAVTGSVVGETMLGGDGVSALPEVLGTWASGSWASGSEIGMPDSSDPPQGVEAGV